MKWMTRALMMSAFAVVTFTCFLISLTERAAAAPLAAEKSKYSSIQSVELQGEGDASELFVKLSAPATYTSYKTTAPLRLVIDFSQTTAGAIDKPVIINKGNFKTVTVSRFDTDAGVLTRMDVELVKDAEAVLTASPANPGELRIAFPALKENIAAPPALPESVAPVAPETPAATVASAPESKPGIPPIAATEPETANRSLTSIVAKDNTILLALDGALKEYKSFKLSKPERYVVDLIGVQSALPTRLISLNSAGVASARIGLYPDKVRVVFDPVNDTFPDVTSEKNDGGILIRLESKPDSVDLKAVAAVTAAPVKTLEEPKAEMPDAHIEPVEAAPVAVKAAPLPQSDAQAQADERSLQATPLPRAVENKALPPVAKTKSPAVNELPAAKPAPQSLKTETPAVAAPSKTKIAATQSKPAKTVQASQIEMLDFQVVDGVTRVSVKVKGDIVADKPLTTPGFITMTIRNSTLPKNLQRSIETKAFITPVLRITPFAVKNKMGSDTRIRIAMRLPATCEMRQEGDMLYLDIKNPEGLTADMLAVETQEPKQKSPQKTAPKNSADQLTSEISPTSEPPAKSAEMGRNYKGRKITLEFADAEVRKIFQLLSEVSNKNFVLGDDVSGAISLKLVNVPWDQALDIILDTKGLDKREDGNIILIKGKGKFKTQAEEEQEIKKALTRSIELKTETYNINYADISTIAAKFAGLKSDRGTISQDSRTNKVIVKDIPQNLEDMRKLLVQLDVPEKQVMIEARIVEASSSFTRNLGVNWGVHFRDGSASFLGINSMDTGFGGLTSAPPTSGTGTSAGGSMGISFGTLASNIQLDMRLNAAASAGMVKIVSTPKIATLNNKMAKITQGQQIPYTSSTSDKVETKFIEAALSLEVTPHINANGTIGMKIDAKNDSPGQATGSGAPPINKKQATTEMLLRDGETTVIGGIYVDTDNSSDDGVPYLMDIPLLGKLFKTSNKSKTKTELLIFITPRILGNI